MKRSAVLWLLFQVCLCFSTSAQVVERSRPEKWKQLVPGARFVEAAGAGGTLCRPFPADARWKSRHGNLGCGQCALQICRQWYRITRNLILGWKHFEIIRWEISSVRVRLGGKFSERTWNMVGLYCVPCGM